MARGRSTTAQQEQEIRKLVTLGITAPKQVYRHLVESGFLNSGNWVSERTIARRIRDLVPQDESGPWSPIEEESEATHQLAEVFRQVFARTDGRVWLTKEFMSWVRKVVDAVPSVPPLWAYAFARSYRDARARGEETMCLDLALVYGFWRRDVVFEGSIRVLPEDTESPQGADSLEDDPFIQDFEEEDPMSNWAVISRGCKLIGGEVGLRQLYDVNQARWDLAPAVIPGETEDTNKFYPRWQQDAGVRSRIDAGAAFDPRSRPGATVPAPD